MNARKTESATEDANKINNKFEAFTIMQPNSPKILEDLRALEKEKKEEQK